MDISKIMYTTLAGTVGATVKVSVRFHTMTNDLAAAIFTSWCKRVDGTLETVEHMRLAVQIHLEAFIIFVPAYFTFAVMTIASKKVLYKTFCCFHENSLPCKRNIVEVIDRISTHPEVDLIVTHPHHPMDGYKFRLLHEQSAGNNQIRDLIR